MNPNLVVCILIAYCLIREVYFMWSQQKLVNKLMCRNYHEFQVSEKAGKIVPNAQPKIPADSGDNEDLNYLSGIL